MVERNGRTPTKNQRYDGQFIGFSATGPVAPVYAVNIDQTETNCFSNGVRIIGNSSLPVVFTLGDCPLSEDEITNPGGGADTLFFDSCDFQTIATGPGRCAGLQQVGIGTRGLTTQVSVLDPSCRTVVLSFRDGLLQQVQTL